MDRPAQTDAVLGRGSKEFQSALREYQNVAERVNNVLRPEGLPLLKAYVENRLCILLHLNLNFGTDVEQSLHLVLRAKRTEAGVVEEQNAAVGHNSCNSIERHFSSGGDQNLVLVGDVEFMEAIQPFALPVGKGLYVVNDSVSDRIAGAMAGVYVSLDCGAKIFGGVTEVEASPLRERVVMMLNEYAICVVERSPEVMRGITDYGSRVAGKLTGYVEGPIAPFILVCLGVESLCVFAHKRAEDTVQLVDVMFGPFHL